MRVGDIAVRLALMIGQLRCDLRRSGRRALLTAVTVTTYPVTQRFGYGG